ncbi:hypothetical protein ASG49_13045 [Marmoricola sp. Leaf446]|uniref:NAD(P)-dependent oxidoreductase n=1 Tax=Marmoricola sp. Leaf446 TaxID=1736379 RepID=UPI0007003A85|nr:NAD(P)-dependent oxidoreductase [Marmoricola sp. Leaf446]KQT90683.1 hypothetical protein ASG49_13045 [Marmoricola sp. Leaf446]
MTDVPAADDPAGELPVGVVGVVGLGAMGRPMALALGSAGPVLAWDADPGARDRAVGEGVALATSLEHLARECGAVVLSLPSAAVVAQVVAQVVSEVVAQVAEVAGAGPELLLLDTSTIGPEDSRSIAATARAAGATYLDTPVLGRPEMVGRWTVPMGGPAAAQPEVARVLAPVAARVVHVGDVGAGATLKVANNLMFSVINAVTAEALVLATAAGLDPGVFVDTVVDSGAASVSGLFRSIAPRAVAGDFDPIFALDLVRKDNALAVGLAASLGVELPVGAAALALHEQAVEAGHGAEDSVAVVKVLEERLGRPARRTGT